ncbi:hypothetical protein UlMin_039908 [Ulmus minor]
METQIPLIQTLATFLSLFLLTYLFARFIFSRSWGPKHVAEASSCAISLVHGTPAVLLAIHALTTCRSGNFASPNTDSQNLVLDFSIAYFMVDLLHYLLFFPTDLLFIGHHLATLYVFTTCRFVVRHGAFALLVLLVLAEVTSGCQNLWTLSGFRKDEEPKALKLHEFLSPRFYVFYSVCRGVLGPFFVFKMGAFYASGAADEVIPKWAWISWMLVIGVATLLSNFWVFNLWIDWYNKRSLKSGKQA